MIGYVKAHCIHGQPGSHFTKAFTQSINLRRFLWISKVITVDSVQNLDFIDALSLCLKLRVKSKLISYLKWYPGQLAYQLDV